VTTWKKKRLRRAGELWEDGGRLGGLVVRQPT
jgi:hypothetical protein